MWPLTGVRKKNEKKKGIAVSPMDGSFYVADSVREKMTKNAYSEQRTKSAYMHVHMMSV
jgi:sugar lactone lactonase YvrE